MGRRRVLPAIAAGASNDPDLGRGVADVSDRRGRHHLPKGREHAARAAHASAVAAVAASHASTLASTATLSALLASRATGCTGADFATGVLLVLLSIGLFQGWHS